MNWYLDVLKKYAVFNGRARRKEYWMFFLFNVIISIVLLIVDGILGTSAVPGTMGLLGAIYLLALLVPGIAVAVRVRQCSLQGPPIPKVGEMSRRPDLQGGDDVARGVPGTVVDHQQLDAGQVISEAGDHRTDGRRLVVGRDRQEEAVANRPVVLLRHQDWH